MTAPMVAVQAGEADGEASRRSRASSSPGRKIEPMAAASAVLLPEMPDRNIPTTTFTCASPPRRWPDHGHRKLDQALRDAALGHHVAGQEEEGQREQRERVDPGEHLLDRAPSSGRSATQITSSEHRISENEIGTPMTMNTVIETSRMVSGWVMPGQSDRSAPRRGRGVSPVAIWRQSRTMSIRQTSDIRTPLTGITIVGTQQRDAERRRQARDAQLRELPAGDHDHDRGHEHAEVDDQPLHARPGRPRSPWNMSNDEVRVAHRSRSRCRGTRTR